MERLRNTCSRISANNCEHRASVGAGEHRRRIMRGGRAALHAYRRRGMRQQRCGLQFPSCPLPPTPEIRLPRVRPSGGPGGEPLRPHRRRVALVEPQLADIGQARSNYRSRRPSSPRGGVGSPRGGPGARAECDTRQPAMSLREPGENGGIAQIRHSPAMIGVSAKSMPARPQCARHRRAAVA